MGNKSHICNNNNNSNNNNNNNKSRAWAVIYRGSISWALPRQDKAVGHKLTTTGSVVRLQTTNTLANVMDDNDHRASVTVGHFNSLIKEKTTTKRIFGPILCARIRLPARLLACLTGDEFRGRPVLASVSCFMSLAWPARRVDFRGGGRLV